jgi:predicted site-specific integrase-resolvase
MSANTGQDIAVVRGMAATLECFIEEDFQQLAGATANTVEAWRKRGQGPTCIRLGNRYLYPYSAVAAYFESIQRERKPVAKALL